MASQPLRITPTVRINVSGARGESQADILRRTGRYGVLPTDTDDQVMGKLNAQAEAAASVAEAFVGPTYATVAAGLAGTSEGQSFAVTNGGLTTVYRKTAGSAVYQRDALSLAAFASTGASKGADIPAFSQNAVSTPGSVSAKLQQILSLGDAPYINAASDNIAIDQAISKAASFSEGGVIHLPHNRIFELTEREIPRGVYIDAGKAAIRARSATPCLFKCVSGFAGITGGFWLNSAGLAERAIIIDKGFDNHRIEVTGGYYSQFTTAVEVANGDCIHVDRNDGVSNGLMLLVTNEFMNSSFNANYVLGGNGVSVQKDDQGCEGSEFNDNWILLGPAGSYGMNFQCGLHIDVKGNVLDQVVNGNGLTLDGTIDPLSSFTINSNWMGRQAGAAGADYGLYAYGNIDEVDISYNTFSGFQQANVFLDGTSPGVMTSIRVMNNMHRSADRALRDIQLAYVDGINIFGEMLSGIASIVEGPGVSGRVDSCDFDGTAIPSAGIFAGLRYGEQLRGMTLRKLGTAIIDGSTKQVQLVHGLSFQPPAANFRVSPTALASNPVGEIYVDSIDASNAMIRCRNAPGSGGAPVAWEVDITR